MLLFHEKDDYRYGLNPWVPWVQPMTKVVEMEWYCAAHSYYIYKQYTNCQISIYAIAHLEIRYPRNMGAAPMEPSNISRGETLPCSHLTTLLEVVCILYIIYNLDMLLFHVKVVFRYGLNSWVPWVQPMTKVVEMEWYCAAYIYYIYKLHTNCQISIYIIVCWEIIYRRYMDCAVRVSPSLGRLCL